MLDPKLHELLDRWEDLQEQGQEVSPEELCREHPELLAEFKKRIKILKAMTWLLEDSDPSGEDGHDEVSSLPPTLDRYRLDEPVGAGGFGQVWKGFDPQLQRVVAIKVPRRDRLSNAQADAFVAEARKVARLRHPGIVPVHDVGKAGQYCYIVSDFIDGGNLANRLRQARPSWHETVRLIVKIAEILHHAQWQGFVHRDIKPANILLDQSGQPYLTDFGIAATKEELRAGHSASIGTLAYMSPEQILGRPVDTRSDIYSLGVVLFEMLTGGRPFSGKNSQDLREQILSDSPALGNTTVPHEVEAICLKCLAREPGQRYTTAGDLAAALEEVLRKPQRRRHPGYALGFFALVGFVVLGLTGYWATTKLSPPSSPAVSKAPEQTPFRRVPASKSTTSQETLPKAAATQPTVSPRTTPPQTESSPSNKNTQQLMAQAITLFDQKSYQEAANACTQVIEQDPKHAKAYHRRGACHYNLGDMDHALADFNKAIDLAPTAETYQHRALVYFRQKEYERGLADARKELELEPANTGTVVMGLIARAADSSGQHRWEDAIADFDEVLRLEPRNAEAFRKRGSVHYNAHDFDQAIADLTRSIEIAPTHADSYLYRSYAYRAKGQVKEADADLAKSKALRAGR